MADRRTFEKVYKLLENVTPLTVDCGELCEKRCCSEWEKGVGMYLLPGEEAMFSGDEDWLEWELHSTEEYEFCPSWSGAFHFVRCTKPCPREKRPFECRTFPLVPHITEEGVLEVRFNDDALHLCPLVRCGDLSLLDPRFVRNVRKAWELLILDPMIKEDVIWQSRNRDKDESAPWKKLFR